jgi:hypothetical protein
MIHHTVFLEHHRNQAHGLCLRAAAWHAGSISTGECGKGITACKREARES